MGRRKQNSRELKLLTEKWLDEIYVYKGKRIHEKCHKVVLSDKAFAKIVSETFSYGSSETGGILIGIISNGIWYVTDVIDAGLIQDTTHTTTYFVYDEKYVNHRIGKESVIYKYQPTCLGFFHRHPGSMDTFSKPDERTMKEHCDMSIHGILSMLVNIDPEFRMTFYYASKQRELFQVQYQIGDCFIPKEYMEVESYEEIARRFKKEVKLKSEERTKKEPALKDVAENSEQRAMPEKKEIRGVASRELQNADLRADMAILSDIKLLERISLMDANRHKKKEKLMVPEGLLEDDRFEGPIYGFMPDTGAYSVLSWGENDSYVAGSKMIGYKLNSKDTLKQKMEEAKDDMIFIRDGAAGLFDVASGKIRMIEMESYSMYQSLTSRNSGLLETEWMKDATAIISGCGSVGSLISCQLARAGIGNIVLIDPDNLEIHNVCRHQLDLSDLGREKVYALSDKLKLINPEINIVSCVGTFQEIPLSDYYESIKDKDKTVFIGTCDNRIGNAQVCKCADDLGIAFAALGFMSRAWGAEIFTMLPGQLDYETVFQKQIREAVISERNSHLYLDEADQGQVTFEPGLDVDIEYGTSFFDKLVLDILNRKNATYHMRFLNQLTQYTLLAGTQNIPDEFYNKYIEPFTPTSVELASSYHDLKKSC